MAAGFAGLSPVARAFHRETIDSPCLRSIAAPVGFASVNSMAAARPLLRAGCVRRRSCRNCFDVLVARPRGTSRLGAGRLTQSIGAWGRDHGARFVSAIYQVVGNQHSRALRSNADLGLRTAPNSYAYRGAIVPRSETKNGALIPWEKKLPAPGVNVGSSMFPKKTIHQMFEEICALYGDRAV